MKVFKFGGASVKDAPSIANVGRIVNSFKKEKLLVVISAMGKTTNALENIMKSLLIRYSATIAKWLNLLLKILRKC